MDPATFLGYAGELSALLVSGGLLLAASVAAKESRKRSRDDRDDEETEMKVKTNEDLSDGEEDSISVEWRHLRKLLKDRLQIELVANKSETSDEKYVRLNFSSKLPVKPTTNDESMLIRALTDAGIKVLGSEDVGVLCVSKSDLGFLSSEEVLKRLALAVSVFATAKAAAIASETKQSPTTDDDNSENENEKEIEVASVSSLNSDTRRRRTVSRTVNASTTATATSAVKRRKIASE